MQMQTAMDPINPAPFLRGLVGHRISVKTKWGMCFNGRLVSCDSFMNIQLHDAEEVLHEQHTEMGEMLIRCNNVLYIRALQE